MNNNESLNKYSYYVEGETEEWFIKNLKTRLLNAKNKSLCKNHSNKVSGAFNEKNLDFNNDECCIRFIIFDNENSNKEKIKNIITNLSLNNIVIINNPFFEVILLMFFEKIYINSNLNKNNVISKINKHLKENGCKFKYNHNSDSLEKFIEFIIKNNKRLNLIENWENNLKFYDQQHKDNKLDFSTFYEVILFLKRENK